MINLNRYWYSSSLHLVTILLLPFSWLFFAIVALRKYLYRAGFKKTYRFNIPIIVVGNITVGGTGKTPLVLWLVDFFKRQGFTPGIVTRGVGGKKQYLPCVVDGAMDPQIVGDEALLLAKRAQCPVVICVDRVAAVEKLLSNSQCNIVISDDGLQHYRLARDIEIAVVDGVRRYGNEKLLPAGPLREPIQRLQHVDFIVANGVAKANEFSMQLSGNEWVCLANAEQRVALIHFKNTPVHAVAGIGNPARFFSMLKQAGLTIIEHVFPDHYLFQEPDFTFPDDFPILMTEKDAVKCVAFAKQNMWYLPVNAVVDEAFAEQLLAKL